MAQVIRIHAGEQVDVVSLLFLINGVAQSLTGGTLSATLRSIDKPSGSVVSRAATGSLVAGANLGSYTYTPSSADAVAGDYEFIMAATFAGPKLSVADAIPMRVEDH